MRFKLLLMASWRLKSSKGLYRWKALKKKYLSTFSRLYFLIAGFLHYLPTGYSLACRSCSTFSQIDRAEGYCR